MLKVKGVSVTLSTRVFAGENAWLYIPRLRRHSSSQPGLRQQPSVWHLLLSQGQHSSTRRLISRGIYPFLPSPCRAVLCPHRVQHCPHSRARSRAERTLGPHRQAKAGASRPAELVSGKLRQLFRAGLLPRAQQIAARSRAICGAVAAGSRGSRPGGCERRILSVP